MLRTRHAVVIVLALSGCAATVRTPSGEVLADCYAGLTLSFCRVARTDHASIVTGAGFLPNLNGSAAIVTEGAVIAK